MLALRAGIVVHTRPLAAGVTYVLEDEAAGSFFRLGEPEYVFVSLLDGRRPFADVFAQAAAISGEAALSEQQAAGLCKWLVEAGLASTDASRQADRLAHATGLAARQQAAQKRNPLFLKTPLGSPDPVMQLAARWLGWLFATPMLGVAFALWIVGGIAAGMAWMRHAGHTITASDGFWIAGCWLLLRVVHEGAHGVAARRTGCPVREWGLTWILLVPLPYVDVTATWRLDRRRDRMLVAAAGMIAELSVAAVAAIVWWLAPPGPLREHAAHLMLSASVVTVLFNANPLMRFDGYHLIADALDQPNLAAHGQQAIRSLGRRWVLGLPTERPRYPEGRATLVLAYGAAAMGWRVLLCVSLIVAAEQLLWGAGVVLAIAAAALWIVKPAASLLWFVARGTPTEQPSRVRFAAVLSSAAVLIAAAAIVPWAPPVTAPAVYDFDPVVAVRSDASGFITTIDVAPGQTVRAGDRLLTLRNPALHAERAELQVELASARHRSRMQRHAGQIAAAEVEERTADVVQQRLDDVARRIAALTVTAPADGLVLSRSLDDLVGRYAAAGTMLLELGSARRRVIALVAEQDRGAVQIGQPASVALWGRSSPLAGRVARIAPQATTRVTHPALVSTAGGPLAIRTVSEAESRDGVVLLRPRLEVRIDLDGDAPGAGRTGQVRLGPAADRLGPYVAGRVADWWDNRHTIR